MKSKFVMLSIVLLVCAGVKAQKSQIKSAQIEFDNGNSPEALKILNSSEYLIFNSTDEDKSEFFFLKGNVLKDLAGKNIDMVKNLSLASKAYKDLVAAENEAGKYKYTLPANAALREMKSTLASGALADYKANKFKESAEKSYNVYLFDKNDTVNLFYAASTSMAVKDYDSAIKYYEELRRLNYSGKGTFYYATNKKTKTEELFANAGIRDSSVAAGTHDKPRNELSASKKLEINKNAAFIYVEKQDAEKAEICYNKVLEIDPNYIDAYINLTYLKLESKKVIVDEMNNLGNTPKEMEQYDQLKTKKDDIVKSVIPYLKKALVIDPKNQDVLKSLLGVYRSLDMTAEYNELKTRI
jgi:tetratricopeptide (TPR) repeat protein